MVNWGSQDRFCVTVMARFWQDAERSPLGTEAVESDRERISVYSSPLLSEAICQLGGLTSLPVRSPNVTREQLQSPISATC